MAGFVMRGYECQHCGKPVPPQRLQGTGRPRLFCSDKCRKAAFRLADFDRRYKVPGAGRNPEKTPAISTPKTSISAGRASPEVTPKNSISAIFGEMTMAKVPAEVRDIEQPWRDAGKAIVSSDGVTVYIVGRLRRPRC